MSENMNKQEQVFAEKLGKKIKRCWYCPVCSPLESGYNQPLEILTDNKNWLFCPKCDLLVKIMVVEGVD